MLAERPSIHTVAKTSTRSGAEIGENVVGAHWLRYVANDGLKAVCP